jgi:heme oxygenase (biliverdin-IX-beta and delta-forming)
MTLLDDVRHATRALHHRVEARFGDGHSFWTLEQYIRLLRVTHAIVQPLEPLLDERLGEIFAAPPPVGRAQRLEADLEAMGAAADTVAGGLTVQTDAEAFGVGYVLQGSLLGGAIISRQVRRTAGTPAATTYVDMYGKGLGAAWARYCASLNAFGQQASGTDRAAVVSSAVATFAAFDAAIDRVSLSERGATPSALS